MKRKTSKRYKKLVNSTKDIKVKEEVLENAIKKIKQNCTTKLY